MTTPVLPVRDGARDFDFLMGQWRVHNRRLKARLCGCTEWVEFEATSHARPLLSGLGNEDEFRTDWRPGFVGMAVRLYHSVTGVWAIYWADHEHATFEPPVFGRFTGEVGTFEGDDTFEGKPIRVRFTWTRLDGDHARWEQAFSADGGRTWETNWMMDFARAR